MFFYWSAAALCSETQHDDKPRRRAGEMAWPCWVRAWRQGRGGVGRRAGGRLSATEPTQKARMANTGYHNHGHRTTTTARCFTFVLTRYIDGRRTIACHKLACIYTRRRLATKSRD